MTTPDLRLTRSARAWRGNLHIWLAGLLVLQLGIITFAYWSSAATAPAGGLLLPDMQAGDIQRLTIEDQTGQSVTLVRANEGWIVADTDGYPANSLKANETLDKLLAINLNRPVTRTEASHSRLQVADQAFNRRITLVDAAGIETILYLGISAGAAATHVRAQDNDVTYLTGQIAAWEVEPYLSGWINTAYHSVPIANIRSLTLRNSHGEIALTRDEDEQWTLAALEDDETLDVSQANTVVNGVASINLLDVLGQSPPEGYDPDAPLVEVELVVTRQDDAAAGIAAEESETTESEEPDSQTEIITLYFGELAPSDSGAEQSEYFAKSSTSEYYVSVSSFLAEQLIERTRADLIAPAVEDVDDGNE